MLREHLAKKGPGEKDGFRWRSHEISRIEGFSDAVFAFAVTLLVVSLEVPETFSELWEKMHGFAAFAICFVLLFMVWHDQYIFFRRYALKDAFTTWMNGALLFVVLFFVYPLKFLFTMLVKAFSGASLEVHLPDGTTEAVIQIAQVPRLMIIYGLGFIAVSTIFVLLYHHAYRQRADLELNEAESLKTRASVQSHLLNIAVGLLSITIVVIGGPGFGFWSGICYSLIGPLQWLNGSLLGSRLKKLRERHEAA